MTNHAAPQYTITSDPKDDDCVIVTESGRSPRRIHREEADPEHRFTAYRLAAGWFMNLPDRTPEA